MEGWIVAVVLFVAGLIGINVAYKKRTDRKVDQAKHQTELENSHNNAKKEVEKINEVKDPIASLGAAFTFLGGAIKRRTKNDLDSDSN